jgi:hypothetical protein
MCCVAGDDAIGCVQTVHRVPGELSVQLNSARALDDELLDGLTSPVEHHTTCLCSVPALIVRQVVIREEHLEALHRALRAATRREFLWIERCPGRRGVRGLAKGYTFGAVFSAQRPERA